MRDSLCVLPVLFIAAVLAGSPASAAGERVSLGSSLGATLYWPDDEDVITLIGIPGGPSDGFMPGFRLGVCDQYSRYVFGLDVGFGLLAYPDYTNTTLMLTGNVVFAIVPQRTSPFVTVGGGILRSSREVEGHHDSRTDAIVGGGIGVRAMVADGHGDIRLEVRYDRILDEYGANLVGMRLGFDLFVK